MSKKQFPYTVTIIIHKDRFRELLAWLRDQNHELRVTMEFGVSNDNAGSDKILQPVRFRDKNAAMMFKLAWGGK